MSDDQHEREETEVEEAEVEGHMRRHGGGNNANIEPTDESESEVEAHVLRVSTVRMD